MKYFRDLIERLGKALRVKIAPLRTRRASTSAAPFLRLVSQQDRR
jgi:hypothetical protein